MESQSKGFKVLSGKFKQLKADVLGLKLFNDEENTRYQRKYTSLDNLRKVIEGVLDTHDWSMALSSDLTNSKVLIDKTANPQTMYKIELKLTYVGAGIGILRRGKGEYIQLTTETPINRCESGDLPKAQELEVLRAFANRCTIISFFGLPTIEQDSDIVPAIDSRLNEESSQTATILHNLNEIHSIVDKAGCIEELEKCSVFLNEKHDLHLINDAGHKTLTTKIASKVASFQAIIAEEELSKAQKAQAEIDKQKQAQLLLESKIESLTSIMSFHALQDAWVDIIKDKDQLPVNEFTALKRELFTIGTKILQGAFEGSITLAESVVPNSKSVLEIHSVLEKSVETEQEKEMNEQLQADNASSLKVDMSLNLDIEDEDTINFDAQTGPELQEIGIQTTTH